MDYKALKIKIREERYYRASNIPMSRSITAYIRLFMRSKNRLSYIVCNTIDISRNMKNLGMKIR